MQPQTKSSNNARFDAKLSIEQKELFELAAKLGGFRTLTEFVIHSVQEKAKSIIEDYQTILATERDREIFISALLNPKKPNIKLRKAATRYNKILAK